MISGSGSDTSVLRSEDDTDLILNFRISEDHFALDGLTLAELTSEGTTSFGLIKF